MPLFRLIRTLGLKLSLMLVAWSLCTSSAQASTGAFFERNALSNKQYSLTLSSHVSASSRTDFSTPTFLFGQDLQELSVKTITTDLKAQIDLLEGIALQIEIPLLVRQVNATHNGLQVSTTQALPPQERSYSSAGMGDPRLTLSIELFSAFEMDYFLDLGTRTPLDDSPEGQPTPTQVPTSTGQNEIFIGGGFNTTLGPVRASLSYRHSYFPGNTTAYLLRRGNNGSWVNGSTTAFIRESVSIAMGIPISTWGDLRVQPTWTLTDVPGVTDRTQSLALSSDSFLQEVTLEVGLDIKLGRHHILRPYLAAALLKSWTQDPFYPIEAPTRGFGLAWQYTSY